MRLGVTGSALDKMLSIRQAALHGGGRRIEIAVLLTGLARAM